VCIVVPARNESANLAKCLRSVLGQDYAALSVVVADDRSEDDTARVAEAFATDDPRLSVRLIKELPSGWLGKSHALWSATRDADVEWLLFLDADCTLDRSAVRTVVAEARRRDVELLTLWPRHASGGFWEHVTIPLCAGIVALWFGSQRVNEPGSRLAFANGQFLLIKREAYERIGGHRSVRSALIEDVPLAEYAKRAGVSCWVASGRDLVAVRMYSGYEAIRDGWARIYVGALRSGTKILLSVAWLLAGSLLPYVAAVFLSFSVVRTWISGGAVDMQTVIFGGL
jgi:chlorobactene glucosyltransferase